MTLTRGATMADGRVVTFAPHPGPQTLFLSSNAHECGYGGAAGGGKSEALLFGPLGRFGQGKCRVLFCRESFPQLQEAEDRAGEFFPQIDPKARWSGKDHRWTFSTGDLYMFGYADNYEGVRRRYGGWEFTDVQVDEAGEIEDERTFDYLGARVRSSRGLKGRKRSSANPGGKGHGWYKRRYIDPSGGVARQWKVSVTLPDGTTVSQTRAFVPARLSDNPSLGADYHAELAMKPERIRRQLLEGDWTAGEGLFFPHPARWVPTPDTLPPWWRYWAAFDWGFRHPMAAMAFAQDGDGTTYVLDTVRRAGLSDVEQVQLLRARFPAPCLKQVYAGTDAFAKRRAHEEASETVADVFAAAKVLLVRASTDRVPGWNAVLRAMEGGAASRLVWCDTPSNRAAWERISVLPCAENDPNDVEKTDVDADTGQGGDDEADALRYGLASGPRKPRQQPAGVVYADAFTPGVDDEPERRGGKLRVVTHPASPREQDDQFPEGW